MPDCGVYYARSTRPAWAKWRKKMLWQYEVHSLETCRRDKTCTAHAWCLLESTWDYAPRSPSTFVTTGVDAISARDELKFTRCIVRIYFHLKSKFFCSSWDLSVIPGTKQVLITATQYRTSSTWCRGEDFLNVIIIMCNDSPAFLIHYS